MDPLITIIKEEDGAQAEMLGVYRHAAQSDTQDSAADILALVEASVARLCDLFLGQQIVGSRHLFPQTSVLDAADNGAAFELLEVSASRAAALFEGRELSWRDKEKTPVVSEVAALDRTLHRDPAIEALSGLGEAAANLVEISGVIKWFDASKGYGFIVPDNGAPDVLLHVTVLRRDGYQTAYEGARLVVECVQRAKGYQAFRILSMDESTAIHPAQMLPARTHVSVTPTSGLERAQVKWFNRLRGFGFLTCGEGTPDIFVHMETLRRFGMTELRPGQYVLVRFGPGSKGMMAAEIQPETGSPGQSLH
jgi:CspA family cold shock protein